MILTENYSAIDERSWNEARNALAGIADVAFTLQVNSIDICFLNARAEHTGVKVRLSPLLFFLFSFY